jgi:hypothetical protein
MAFNRNRRRKSRVGAAPSTSMRKEEGCPGPLAKPRMRLPRFAYPNNSLVVSRANVPASDMSVLQLIARIALDLP